MKILYKENGFCYIRKDNGQLGKIPSNKFEDGEIVMITEKHYSKEQRLSILEKPSYTENRGWVYTEHFINLQGDGSGCGCWNNEDHYKKINNPILKLYAERIRLINEINLLKQQLETKENAFNMIEFALSKTSDQWYKIEKICSKCNSLFIKNTTNVNLDICDDCT